MDPIVVSLPFPNKADPDPTPPSPVGLSGSARRRSQSANARNMLMAGFTIGRIARQLGIARMAVVRIRRALIAVRGADCIWGRRADPFPELSQGEILQAVSEIQEGWTEAERMRRARNPWSNYNEFTRAYEERQAMLRAVRGERRAA